MIHRRNPSTRLGSLLTSFFIGALAFAGCSTGPEKQNVRWENPPERIRQGVTYVKLWGSLKTEDGQPVSGVKVRAKTSHFDAEDVTTRNGSFRIDAIFGTREMIEFRFSSDAVNWTEMVRSVPPGKDVVYPRFVLERAGRIRLAAVEY